MEIMAKKSLLDEIIQSDSNQSFENENEILEPILDEIEMIEDESIKSFVRSVLIKAKSFWIIPSSFSGKYHPPDEHDSGGNVLHTKRVARVANTLCESHSVTGEERDVVLAACLIHDVTKGVENSSSEEFEYDPLHPYTVGHFVEKCIEHDKEYGGDECSSCLFLSEEAVNTILRLVRCHLGPWSPVPETFPITYLDYIVHIADNVASKIHNYIIDSDLINDKWRSS